MPKMDPELVTLLTEVKDPLVFTCLDDAIFSKYAQEATDKRLGVSPWLSVGTATAIAFKSPALMMALYNHATASSNLSESIAIAEFMRDVGIGGIAVIGIPRVINMLTAFYASLPSTIRSSLSCIPSKRADASNIASIQWSGQALWSSVHHPMDETIDRTLANAHPDLPNYIKDHIYGGLLMRPRGCTGGTVGRLTISLSAIAYIRADQGSIPQLRGHILGLQKAWKDGSWKSEPSIGSTAGIQWLTSDEGCVWVLRMVDNFRSALSRDMQDPARGKL